MFKNPMLARRRRCWTSLLEEAARGPFRGVGESECRRFADQCPALGCPTVGPSQCRCWRRGHFVPPILDLRLAGSCVFDAVRRARVFARSVARIHIPARATPMLDIMHRHDQPAETGVIGGLLPAGQSWQLIALLLIIGLGTKAKRFTVLVHSGLLSLALISPSAVPASSAIGANLSRWPLCEAERPFQIDITLFFRPNPKIGSTAQPRAVYSSARTSRLLATDFFVRRTVGHHHPPDFLWLPNSAGILCTEHTRLTRSDAGIKKGP